MSVADSARTEAKPVSAISQHLESRVSADPAWHDDDLTCLIGHVYDAALDAARWPDALERVGRFVGGRAGGILSKDAISRSGTPFHVFGVDPRFVRIYAETHS